MFSDDQPAFEVSVRELARDTSAVLRRVRGGERGIVTRNGRPDALVIGLADAIDVALAGSERMALLRREAREALVSGQLVGLAHLRGMHLTEATAGHLTGLGRQRRGRLRWRLHQCLLRPHEPGLSSVTTETDLAAIEAHSGERGIAAIVYAILSLESVRDQIFGSEPDRRFRSREIRRLLHG